MARPAPAATRAVQILDLLVTHPTERFTLSEIVRRTGMSLGSAHAVLAVLESSGHVTRHPGTRAYSLGPALVVAGVVALEHHPGIDAARAGLGALAESLGLEVVVTARTLDEIIFIARSGVPSPHGPRSREGERVPLVPPFGTVFMAWADPEDVSAWLARSPDPSPATLERYRVALDLVRARGWSITAGTDAQRALGERSIRLTDHPNRPDLRRDVNDLLVQLAQEDYPMVDLDGQHSFDVGMIAAPVFGPDATVIAAISATGFRSDLDAATIAEAARRIRDNAAVATRASRGRFPTT